MPDEGAVVAQGLGKRYGRRWVLRDLSFTLTPGTLIGLVGGNGGGKTTTLRLMAGLIRPDAGSGSVFGHDIARPGATMRRSIGYMSQRLSLYPELSVAQNIRYRAALLGLPRRAAGEAMARMGLSDFARTRIDRLSGGWARRAQFAAATLGAPRLLLLDEPTAGLDAVARRFLWGRIADYAASGAIVIVSTHDLNEAQHCPLILHYQNGRAEEPMAPDALMARTGQPTLEEAVVALAGGAMA